MGLDSVELVMEVENTFDIRIPDDEASRIFTVGDFYELVWRHLEGRHSHRCSSQVLFYRLRRHFASRLGLLRADIRLEEPLAGYLATKDIYKALERETGLQFPALRLPALLSNIWSWAAGVLIVGSLVGELLLINIWDYTSWILLGTPAAILICLRVAGMLEPWRTAVPSGTMREFTNSVLTLNFRELSKGNGVSRGEMEQIMKEIIINKLGVDAAEVAPDKRFTDDLGMD